MRSAIACSGSSEATSLTKSPEPLAIASSTMLLARWTRTSCWALIERGVKPRLMIWRILVWSGGSWLISMMPCSSTWSRVMSGANRMIAPFSWLEKFLLSLDTAETSACLLIAQKPSPLKPARDSCGCSTHQTGAVRRSSANSLERDAGLTQIGVGRVESAGMAGAAGVVVTWAP